MTYCISDIHGEYDLFMRLLTKIGYSDSDRLIVCGDIVDKGNSSVRLTKTIFSLPNSYCVMGNHGVDHRGSYNFGICKIQFESGRWSEGKDERFVFAVSQTGNRLWNAVF